MTVTKPSGCSTPVEGDIIIAETATGTWHYHLRVVGPEGPLYGGAFGHRALCGRGMGWDTQIPLKTWGVKTMALERYCQKCQTILAQDPELLKKVPLDR